uniref:receptor protein-tyrosine kinase n=1 Tax=Panagrellus redivivus TaxID=6233 RepID=A0A7E4V949_PANRE
MTLFAAILLVAALGSRSVAVVGLDIRQCNRPFGIESGRILESQITASSSFDAQSTGPANARLRSESGSGAWCPESQINESSHEWIQVEFQSDVVISAVETQGRFDKGRGMEFPTGYMVEYWRTSLGRWARYKDRAGNEIIEGNTDTQSTALRILDGAIIAKLVRLIPVSEVTRTVCLRFELHGCSYREGLLSYTAPVGSHLDGLDLRDLTYDGDELDNGRLVNGIGRLFDGVTGSDNFERDPHAWIGWQRDSHGSAIVILEFNFSTRRNFSAISLHTSNSRKNGAGLFSQARVMFSMADDDHYSQRIVHFEQTPDTVFESARWVRIGVNSRLGRRVRLELVFGDDSEWLLVSEVRFESNNAVYRPIDHEFDETDTLTIDGPGSIGIIATDDTDYDFVIRVILGSVAIVIAMVCLGCCVIYTHYAHKSSPIGFTGHKKVPFTPDFYDHQCCGTVVSKRYAPTPEKLSLETDSEYADPDLESALIPKHGSMYRSYYQRNLQPTYSMAPTYAPTNRFDTFYAANYTLSNANDEYATIEIPADSLIPVKPLGNGEFGNIELCQFEGKFVAVKSLKSSDPSTEADFKREIHVMSQLRHQNVVRVIGASTNSRPILCVTEYMSQGDLRNYLQEKPNFGPDALLSLTTQIAAGMAYLESRKFVHRDVAARNCLIDESGTVKIADFGMARSLYASDYYRLDGQFSLPIRWMAPESIFEGRFSHATDVWALGVTIWEVFGMCREKPFAKMADNEVIENLRYLMETGSLKEYLFRPSLCPVFIFSEVLQPCWRLRDSDRPSLAAIHRQLQSAQVRLPVNGITKPPPPPNRAAPEPPCQ